MGHWGPLTSGRRLSPHLKQSLVVQMKLEENCVPHEVRGADLPADGNTHFSSDCGGAGHRKEPQNTY